MNASFTHDLCLRDTMRSCEQMPGLTILGHGQLVAARYRQLIRHLRFTPSEPLPGWRLPSWFAQHGNELLAMQAPYPRALRYQIYHDCAKPLVLHRDEQGKAHFPDHARASAELFGAHYPHLRLEQALIREDMRLHTMAASELDELSSLREEGVLLWPTLLLTALCELHDNAAMFGGVQTTNFKAKLSQVDRRGKALCKRMFV
jgi:hypothetical protein